MKSTLLASLLALCACGSIADPNEEVDPDAGTVENDASPIEPDAANVCTGEESTLSIGNPQGGFSAQKTVAIEVTPVGGDRVLDGLEVAGINLFGGTYTLAARIYDVETGTLLASSTDVTQSGPFPNFTTTFDIAATLTSDKTYSLGVFTSGGGTAATGVFLTDEILPFASDDGAFRIEGAAGSINNDVFPNLNLNGLPQITARSCPD